MKFDNIIWDFDGTLFDTYPTMVKYFKKAFHKYRINLKSKEVLYYLKQSFRVAMKHYCDAYELNMEEVIEKYMEEKSKDAKKKYYPFKGLKSLCKEIVGMKKQSYIYTHRDQLVHKYLEKNKMTKLFIEVLDISLVKQKKPHPEGINYFIEKYKMDKNRTIYVGDRKLDIDAAHAAGIKACLFTPECVDLEIESDYKAKTVKELRKILFL